MGWIVRFLDLLVSPIHWFDGIIWKLTRPRMPTLSADEHGFSFSRPGQNPDRYLWDEVYRITAFKNDLFTCDQICLQISIIRHATPLVISEDFDGYTSFVAAMETHLHDVRKDWWFSVAFPAFAENAFTIYHRSSGVSGRDVK